MQHTHAEAVTVNGTTGLLTTLLPSQRFKNSNLLTNLLLFREKMSAKMVDDEMGGTVDLLGRTWEEFAELLGNNTPSGNCISSSTIFKFERHVLQFAVAIRFSSRSFEIV